MDLNLNQVSFLPLELCKQKSSMEQQYTNKQSREVLIQASEGFGTLPMQI